jgi:hypothetical protein
MFKYTNRYGDVYTFTKQEDGSVLWEGNFERVKVGGDSIDPAGGPYLKAGKMLSHIIWFDEFNVIIESFERVETGYIIKCKEHKVNPNDFSHLADTKIIGGIINTTEE